jgi:hypothetical protein
MKSGARVFDEAGRSQFLDRAEQFFGRLDRMPALPDVIEKRFLVDFFIGGDVAPELTLEQVLVFERFRSSDCFEGDDRLAVRGTLDLRGGHWFL